MENLEGRKTITGSWRPINRTLGWNFVALACDTSIPETETVSIQSVSKEGGRGGSEGDSREREGWKETEGGRVGERELTGPLT